MTTKNKIYIAITLILGVILIVKSLYLDEVKNLTENEARFKSFAEKAVEEKYGGFLKRNKLISYRVVKIQKTSEEGVSPIEYYNETTGRYEKATLEGKYKGRVRRYLLNVVPYGEFQILSP